MKLTKEQAAANRQKIIDTAIHSFKSLGVDSVGVSEIMKVAGFTHGGFYNHFESKDDLVAEAFEQAFRESTTIVEHAAEAKKLPQAFSRYLSAEHRDTPENACPTASFVLDAGRQELKARHAYCNGIKKYLKSIETCFDNSKAKKEKALSTLALMVGAMTLARAISEADDKLSLEFLAAARKTIKESLQS